MKNYFLKKERNMFITQEQYDRWIKNMSKNKSGTSWVYVNVYPEFNARCKLYQDEEKKLYYKWGCKRIYLTIKKEEEDIKDWSFEKCKDWLEDPYNEPDPETDDSFDKAYRSAVKRRLKELTSTNGTTTTL